MNINIENININLDADSVQECPVENIMAVFKELSERAQINADIESAAKDWTNATGEPMSGDIRHLVNSMVANHEGELSNDAKESLDILCDQVSHFSDKFALDKYVVKTQEGLKRPENIPVLINCILHDLAAGAYSKHAKPQVHMVHGVKCPAPVNTAKQGDALWFINLSTPTGVTEIPYFPTKECRTLLTNGALFGCPNEAQENAKALYPNLKFAPIA